VDDYIASSPEFAKPILAHLRQVVHDGCPRVKETVESGRPEFLHQGKTLAVMAVFQTHCAFSFWLPSINQKIAESAVTVAESVNILGHVTKLGDLPSDGVLLSYLREATETIEARRRRSSETRAQGPLSRGIIFLLGAFLTAVFFPTVIANLDYNRRLNDKRLSLAHDAIEHDEQVNALVGEMTGELNIFWVDTNGLKISKPTMKAISEADTGFRKQWENFNNVAWFRYWDLLAEASATQAIRRVENDDLKSVVAKWIEATSTTNMHLGDLEIATLYKPDERKRALLIMQMEADRKNRDGFAYQIYSVLVKNTQPGVWKDLKGLFGNRD